MMRDSELANLDGIAVDEYTDLPVYDGGVREYLEQQARDNAEMGVESETLSAEIKAVKVCTNGNIWLGGSTDENKWVTVFVHPYALTQATDKDLSKSVYVDVKETYTSRGNKITRRSWDIDEDILRAQLKGLEMLLSKKYLKAKEIWELVEIF